MAQLTKWGVGESLFPIISAWEWKWLANQKTFKLVSELLERNPCTVSYITAIFLKMWCIIFLMLYHGMTRNNITVYKPKTLTKFLRFFLSLKYFFNCYSFKIAHANLLVLMIFSYCLFKISSVPFNGYCTTLIFSVLIQK